MRSHVTYVHELRHDELGVGTVLVQIGLDWRRVGLVVVVRAEDTGVRQTTDRPRLSVTVDDGTEDGKETTEILGHTEDGLSSVDKLRDGGTSVARNVAF